MNKKVTQEQIDRARKNYQFEILKVLPPGYKRKSSNTYSKRKPK